ncbi:MAG: hypothetical protein ABR950_11070 [Candidatus Dormibacteria bacterium]|jgi:hypothetical protein
MTSRQPLFAALAVLTCLVAACHGSPATTAHSTGGATPSAVGTGVAVSAAPGASTSPGTSPSSNVPGPTTGPGGCPIAAPATAPSGLTLYVCYTISGAVDASGGFVDSDQGAGALSCADWAENGEEGAGSAGAALQAPDPGDAEVTVNGQDLGFDLVINPYSGPGSYPSTTVAESVSLGDTLSWSTNNAKTATFSAQVSSDGSGSATATALANDSSNGSVESVSESWVCAMEPAA